MARIVADIMNHEVFSVAPTDSPDTMQSCLLGLEITAAPVVGENGRPLGVISLREITAAKPDATASDLMRSPAISVGAQDEIRRAAHLLAENDIHHLVVVDEQGRATGFLSALDVVRGLIGLPAPHPAAFPHLDSDTGISWTDDIPLALDQVKGAPDGPGVWVLIHGGVDTPEAMVWAESADNVCTRLIDLLSLPQKEPKLVTYLERGDLRFRAAAVTDPDQRSQILQRIRERLVAQGEPVVTPRSGE